VGCRDSESIEVIDTATYAVISSLSVPTSYLGAGNIALDPLSGKFYCVDWYGDDLYEIAPDGSAILNQVIDLGSSLWQLVVAPDGQVIYVTDRGTDEVRVVDPTTLAQIGTFPVGDDPWGIDVTEDGNTLVVACEDSHEAYIIDTITGDTVTILLDATADPRDVDVLDAANLAFVVGGRVGSSSNPVYVLDLATNSVMTTFEATCTNTNVIAVQPQMHEVPVSVGVEPPQVAAVTGGVRLSWSYDLAAADGFHVYRRAGNEEIARRLTDFPLNSGNGRIQYFDPASGFAAGTVLHYSHSTLRGGIEVGRSEEVTLQLNGSVPTATVLHPAFPNPFNPITHIKFELREAGRARLAIFDLAGRHIRSLADALLPAGVHERQWNGRNEAGQLVPSGAYYVRLDTGHESIMQKMMLLK
jgi:YVTN family beta-propeller protein